MDHGQGITRRNSGMDDISYTQADFFPVHVEVEEQQ